jgi:hypothetical protein
MKTKSTPIKRATLSKIAFACANGSADDVISAINIARPIFTGKAWQEFFSRLENLIISGTVSHSIFIIDGNSKLPFVAFSSLPLVTCPGAGECAQWCYSLRAWRYPAAFIRQCSNAWLMRTESGRSIISAELTRIGKMRRFQSNELILRLYVDGDFSSVNDVAYWNETLSNNSKVRAYGYSKSFFELLAFNGAWAPNYILNISSGHNHSADTVERIKSLPITRGEFRAVSIGRIVKSSEHGTAPVVRALREKISGGMFPCPGKCGSCTSIGHACGSDRLRGKVIAIAVH